MKSNKPRQIPDPIRLFSDRVEYYVKYRPKYPEKIVDFFIRKLDLNKSSIIADIGSGTGFLAEFFIKKGFNTVIGVEPNPKMRKAAEVLLNKYNGFKSIKGRAEATGLEDQSIDLIVVGEAFHWFKVQQTKREFLRILQPQGKVALLWHERRIDSEFAKAYEDMLNKYCAVYRELVKGIFKRIDKNIIKLFFGNKNFKIAKFKNNQVLDFAGLKGSLLSKSYMPLRGQVYKQVIKALEEIFAKYNKNNKVILEYDTKVYYGELV